MLQSNFNDNGQIKGFGLSSQWGNNCGIVETITIKTTFYSTQMYWDSNTNPNNENLKNLGPKS